MVGIVPGTFAIRWRRSPMGLRLSSTTRWPEFG